MEMIDAVNWVKLPAFGSGFRLIFVVEGLLLLLKAFAAVFAAELLLPSKNNLTATMTSVVLAAEPLHEAVRIAALSSLRR